MRALKWILDNPEYTALAVNSFIFIAFCFQRPVQSGKLLYWGAVVVLTIGLIKMKG